MDGWEKGFDGWTPRPPEGGASGPAADTGTDLDREELLRLARELAARRHGEHEQARVELEELKRHLRERAEAVAARERELEQVRQRLEGSKRLGRGRLEELRAKRQTGQDVAGRESLAARERATHERERAAEAREGELAAQAAELETRGAVLEAEAARIAEQEHELEVELAAAQVRLTEAIAEQQLTAAERERLEERDRAVHEVEKGLAAFAHSRSRG